MVDENSELKKNMKQPTLQITFTRIVKYRMSREMKAILPETFGGEGFCCELQIDE